MDLNSIVSSIQSQALGDVDVVLLEQKGEGQEQGMVHVYLVPRAPSESSRTPTPSLGSVSSPANPMMSPPYVAPNVTPNNLIKGIITDKGLLEPPFDVAIAKVMGASGG